MWELTLLYTRMETGNQLIYKLSEGYRCCRLDTQLVIDEIPGSAVKNTT